MIHLNKCLEENLGIFGRIVNSFIAEYYLAENLSDFLGDRRKIIPSKKRMLFARKLNNGAFVHLNQSVIYNPLNEDEGELSDLSSSVIVDNCFLSERRKEELRERVRLYGVSIFLDLNYYVPLLFDYKTS